LLQKEPSLTPDQVKARLMRTASKSLPPYSIVFDEPTGKSYQTQYDIFSVGAGYLDITAALNDTYRAELAATSPVALFDATTQSVMGHGRGLGNECMGEWFGRCLGHRRRVGNRCGLGHDKHLRLRRRVGHRRSLGHYFGNLGGSRQSRYQR
jgi:hypothetical protein